MKIPVASVGRRRLRRALWGPALVLLLGPLPMVLSNTPAGASPTSTPSGTVYVTNLNLNSVTAIDTASAHITVVHGAPPALNGPLGIAIAPDGRTAYVTNSNSN